MKTIYSCRNYSQRLERARNAEYGYWQFYKYFLAPFIFTILEKYFKIEPVE